MISPRRRWPLGALLLVALLAGGAAARESADRVERLAAFARLYGYVRWFHPGDEAAKTDWDGFAILGSRRVLQVETPGELLPVLQGLFGPIAPTVQIYPADSPPEPLDLIPADADTLDLVAWQHQGVGLRGGGGAYASARTGRVASHVVAGYGFGAVTQSVDAAAWRGREVRLRAAVRATVEGTGNAAQLWLRVDRPDRQRGFFDNMGDRPIRSDTWDTYEIVGGVADDAEKIVFGCLLNGEGEAWVDAFELDVRSEGGEWESVDVPNAGFEEEGKDVPEWNAASPGYEYVVLDTDPFRGARSLRITEQRETWSGTLFDDVPDAGECVEKELGAGLAARIPLALHSRNGRTVDGAGGDALDALRGEITAAGSGEPSPADPAVRAADVTIAWNVFQHFYPYFDVIDTDWGAELRPALADAMDSEGPADYLETLERMVAKLQDGHGRVQYLPTLGDVTQPPFATEWIEDRLVVTAVGETDALRPGDIVVRVEGKDPAELVSQAETLISGSPQWKRWRAARELCWGPADSDVSLEIERDGERQEVSVTRAHDGWSPPPARKAIERLDDGVLYVDLSRAEMDTLDARMEELAAAPGIVFDLRGYPKGNHAVLQHLTDEPLESARWNVPWIIYPDRDRIVGWRTSGRWNLPPEQPRFRGRIAFLTGPGAISYAESVMGIVENYHLGEIVGRPTAGTNGNVNPFELPGGYRVYWTGMKVLKHDGSQHHHVGILPTVPVARTIQGVIDGRDEDLEAALEVIRSS